MEGFAPIGRQKGRGDAMKDARNKLWAELELKIQTSASKKDERFVLRGKWKKFVRKNLGFRIYAVDGEWVRNNLSIMFEHAGHGFVHEFIPLDEIWVDVRHYEGCACKNVREDRKISQKYFKSTILHEMFEFKSMREGREYWSAHQLAINAERCASILEDPYTEDYS